MIECNERIVISRLAQCYRLSELPVSWREASPCSGSESYDFREKCKALVPLNNNASLAKFFITMEMYSLTFRLQYWSQSLSTMY